MHWIFIAILLILVVEFALNQWLDAANARSWKSELPPGAEGIYDGQRYALSRNYFLANHRFGQLASTCSFLLLLAMLLFRGFASLDEWVRSYTESPVGMSLLFFGILALAADVLSLPFALYKVFVIEEKFGFNRTTAKTFVLDKLKGYLVAAIIGGGILALLVSLYGATGKLFWLVGWLVVSLFTVVTGMFYTAWLLPLFNKLTPLAEGELRESIQEYSRANGFALKNIYVMDGSRRSSRANAFFSGLGPRKTIVLYDTLVEKYSVPEVTAVLAHEVGHYKRKHTQKGMMVSILNSGIVFFILSLCLGNPALSAALGTAPSFHTEVLVFGMLYSPLSACTGIVLHRLSRRHEFEADRFAKETFAGKPLSDALKKLTSDNLSNLTPHPVYVYVHYSHPPVLQRLSALEHEVLSVAITY